jgi:hypothetical protein
MTEKIAGRHWNAAKSRGVPMSAFPRVRFAHRTASLAEPARRARIAIARHVYLIAFIALFILAAVKRRRAVIWKLPNATWSS